MVVFPTERDVLARYPVKSSGCVPGSVWITGIFRKVRRSRSCCRSVDGRQQHQVAPWVIDLSAAHRHSEQVPVKPQTVVKHVSEKTLLGPNNTLTANDMG